MLLDLVPFGEQWSTKQFVFELSGINHNSLVQMVYRYCEKCFKYVNKGLFLIHLTEVCGNNRRLDSNPVARIARTVPHYEKCCLPVLWRWKDLRSKRWRRSRCRWTCSETEWSSWIGALGKFGGTHWCWTWAINFVFYAGCCQCDQMPNSINMMAKKVHNFS